MWVLSQCKPLGAFLKKETCVMSTISFPYPLLVTNLFLNASNLKQKQLKENNGRRKIMRHRIFLLHQQRLEVEGV